MTSRPQDRFELTSATSSDEPQVIELCHLILHESSRVPQFRATVLIISRPHGDKGAITDLPQSHHFESHRQSFIRTPVRW